MLASHMLRLNCCAQRKPLNQHRSCQTTGFLHSNLGLVPQTLEPYRDCPEGRAELSVNVARGSFDRALTFMATNSTEKSITFGLPLAIPQLENRLQIAQPTSTLEKRLYSFP